MQGSQNQMMPQMPQHMMGLKQMHPGPVPPRNVPPMGGFPNGMGNIQGASGSSGSQMVCTIDASRTNDCPFLV
jgi:polyadenylation factor subunit 2